MCSGRVGSSCSTSDTRRVNLVTSLNKRKRKPKVQSRIDNLETETAF